MNPVKVTMPFDGTLYRGYAYKLMPGKGWRAPDDCWDIVVIDDLTGPIVGFRTIDGASCMLIKKDGDLYASKNFQCPR